MKRLSIPVLAFLIALLTLSAAGETLYTHCVGIPAAHAPHYASFIQAFPQVSFQADDTWPDSTDALIRALESANPRFDLFSADNDLDIRQLVDAGLCADLSGSAAIRETVGRMWTPIQELVTRGEKIYGLPEAVLLSSFGWCEDAWRAAGLEGTPPPTSYLELLDFLEMWVARIQKAPEPGIRINSMFDESLYNQRSYVKNLLTVLMDCYTLPALREGRRPQFDTPEFRTLLDRTEKVGQALFAAEPPASEGNLQLFENDLEGFGIIGIKDGYSHAMPLRISADQPVLYKAGIRMLCMGAGSGHQELAAAYLEWAASHMHPYAAAYGFVDSQPLMRENLEEDISDQKQRIGKTASRLSQESLSGAKRRELEEQLERQNRVLDTMQTEGWKYLISPQWLSEYKAIAPNLFFPRSEPLVMFSAEGRAMLKLVREFGDGKMSRDEFINRLDGLGE